MTLETLLGPAVPATYLVLLGLETLRPARAWPSIRFWRLLGGAFFLVMGGVVGAQIGVRAGAKLRGEQLRFLLAMMVLAVAIRLAWGLVATPADIYSIVLGDN